MSQQKQVKDWITVNGQHIPIFEGESKSDAVNRAIAKNNEDKKTADIERNKKEAEKLNKGTSKSNSNAEFQKKYNIKWDKSMDSLTSDFQDSVKRQIEHIYKEFPELQGVVKKVMLSKADTDMGLIHGGKRDGTLVISDDFSGKTIEQLGKIDKAFTADNYSQLVYHELAHAIANKLGANAEYRVFKEVGNHSDYDTYGKFEKSGAIRERLSKLSDYANEYTDGEKFAEAIADYMIHGNKNAISEQTYQATKKLLKG